MSECNVLVKDVLHLSTLTESKPIELHNKTPPLNAMINNKEKKRVYDEINEYCFVLVVYGHIKTAFSPLKQARIQFDTMGITAALFFFLFPRRICCSLLVLISRLVQ